METILSRDDKPPSSAAKTSDSVNNIITKSYEDIINVNKQQTNSSVSITKESGEAGEKSFRRAVSLYLTSKYNTFNDHLYTFIKWFNQRCA